MSTLPPIRLVVGSAPPEPCGVGDYTDRLAVALRGVGVDAEVVVQRGDDRLGRALAGLAPGTVVHLQYPSVGMGRSPAPLGTLLRRRGAVTLHEYGYAHPLRRVMGVALANLATALVATTAAEAGAMAARSRHGRPLVIPVPSNVPVMRVATGEQTGVVGWFGLLAPGKGIEQFLDLAARSAATGAARRFVVIGGWRPCDDGAVRRLQRGAGPTVSWTGHLAPAGLSRVFAGLGAAYLPFPDGASERRASLLALLEHGVPVVTTVGPGTTAALRACVAVAREPVEALTWLATSTTTERRSRREAGLTYAASRSWANVAEAHVALYRRIAGAAPGGAVPVGARGAVRTGDRPAAGR